MVPIELLTMAGSAALGFVFRFMRARQENDLQKHKMTMEVAKSGREDREQIIQAGIKDPGFAFTRRLIALGLVYSLVVLPYVWSVVFQDVVFWLPIETEANTTSILWGLFTGTDVSTQWQHLTGVPILPEFTHLVYSVTGFYFGGARK